MKDWIWIIFFYPLALWNNAEEEVFEQVDDMSDTAMQEIESLESARRGGSERELKSAKSDLETTEGLALAFLGVLIVLPLLPWMIFWDIFLNGSLWCVLPLVFALSMTTSSARTVSRLMTSVMLPAHRALSSLKQTPGETRRDRLLAEISAKTGVKPPRREVSSDGAVTMIENHAGGDLEIIDKEVGA